MAANEALNLLDSLRSVIEAHTQEVPSTPNAGSQQQTAALPSAFIARQFLTAPSSSSMSRSARPRMPAVKKRKVSGHMGRDKSFVKDILCIPPSDMTGGYGRSIPIPRGKARGRLVELGLAGKIVLWSSWSNERIVEEVTSIFGPAFGLVEGEQLPFRYLSIVSGMKKLAYPNVSASFHWTRATVAALAGQGGLYIESSLPFVKGDSENIRPKESKVLLVDSDSSDDEGDNNTLPTLGQILGKADTSLQSGANGPLASGTEDFSHSYIELLDERFLEGEAEGVDLQRVLEIDARECSGDYKDILQQHISSQMADDETPKNLLNVRRSFPFIDGIRKINRSTFIPTHGLSVLFADDCGDSEGAVDAGGPTREFLRIALHNMYNNHGLFGGPEHNKVLLFNSQGPVSDEIIHHEIIVNYFPARAKDMYRHCGQFLAVSLCNGGGVGNCMSKAVYDFLVYGEGGSHPQIGDVVDGEAQDTLVRIRDCTEKEAFTKLTRDDQIAEQIFQAGFQTIPKFESKSSLIDGLCRYHVLDRPRSALEQMKEGLKMLGVLELITQHPQPFANLFCYRDAPLTPSVFEEQFKVKYSNPGTSEREHEEQAIMHWRDYLQDCQAGAAKATLAHILIFATGANRVPPLGFDCQPCIGFWEDVRPKANTCINKLYLPLHQYISDIPYDTFKDFMDDGIINSPCFGMA